MICSVSADFAEQVFEGGDEMNTVISCDSQDVGARSDAGLCAPVSAADGCLVFCRDLRAISSADAVVVILAVSLQSP